MSDFKKNALIKLKELRNSKGIPIEDVQRFLASHDIKVAIKTIYGWECAATTPNFEIFILLCSFYGVKDIYKFVNYTEKEKKLRLSEEEKDLVKQYRKKKEFRLPILRLLDLDKKYVK